MIGFGSSDNQVGILIKTTADNKGIDSTSSALGFLDKSSGMSAKSAAIMGAVAGVAQVGITALGSAVKAAGQAAIGGAGDFEQNRVAFETMLGSADKARSLLTEISAFAKSTPFELPEVVAGSKQLLAFGFAQESIIPTMRKLGDIASGVGVPVGQLAYVFGQVRVAGKLMGGDLMQFTNAGVPMIEGLSKVLHVSQGEVKSMVESGKVGFKEVEQVINNMTGSGSQFGGMMDKQSHTFQGVVSNIKDGFGQMLRSAVGVTNAGDIIQGGLFDKLKSGAEKVMPIIQSLADQAGPFMTKAMASASTAGRLFYDTITGGDPTIGKGEERFAKLAKALSGIRDVVMKFLGPSLENLMKTFGDRLMPALKKLLPYVDDLVKIIGAVLVAALWIAINAINIFISGLSFWIDMFFKVKDAIGTVVDWIARRFDDMGNMLKTVFDVAVAVMQGIWDVAVKPVIDLITGALNILFGIYSYIFAVMRGVALEVWWAIYNAAVSPVINAIAAAANWVGGIVSGVWNWISGVASTVWGAVSGFAVSSWQRIAGVWQGVVGWFSGIWNSLTGAASGAAGSIGNIFSTVAGGIKDAFKGAINWIIDKINSLVRSVNGSVGKLPGVPKLGEIPRFSTGVQNFRGGMAVVGDVMGGGGELVSLPTGSDVYTNQQSKSMLQSMGGGQTFVHNGDVILSTPQAVDKWYDIQGRNNELAQRGLTTIRGTA